MDNCFYYSLSIPILGTGSPVLPDNVTRNSFPGIARVLARHRGRGLRGRRIKEGGGGRREGRREREGRRRGRKKGEGGKKGGRGREERRERERRKEEMRYRRILLTIIHPIFIIISD